MDHRSFSSVSEDRVNPYTAHCDEFGVSCILNNKLEITTQREPVLHFFEALQKAIPSMTEFERRDSGEYVLEEDREPGHYRWTTCDVRRLAMGYVAPATVDAADDHNLRVLDMATYHLDLGKLTTEFMDLTYYFEFQYQGNHDEVVAEALAAGSPLNEFPEVVGSRILNYQPSMLIALDEQCQLQARINVETRTSAFQVRTGNFPEVPLSVYLTLRQFWGKAPPKTFDEIAQAFVLPKILQPLQSAIATK
jgi:hypothetical protein